MKEATTLFAIAIFFCAAIVGITWFGTENGFRLTAHYAPKFEDVRRTTYEHSRAFQEGTIRDLDNLRLEYLRGDDAQKAAIADVARHRLADVPVDQLPPSLQSFARQVGVVQ